MPYVIFNTVDSKYVKSSGNWATTLKNATKFATLENVNNFMTNNFSFVFKNTPMSDVEVLSMDNLTSSFSPAVVFTEETATAEMVKLREFVKTMLDMSEKFASLPSYYGGCVRTLDMETQDVLHKIEFTNENVVSGFKRYKQLQDIRQRRRVAKDNLEMSSLLLTSGLLKSLRTMQLEMEKLEQYMQNREYSPRVLTELFDDQEDEAV